MQICCRKMLKKCNLPFKQYHFDMKLHLLMRTWNTGFYGGTLKVIKQHAAKIWRTVSFVLVHKD
jgi:hypothetical protein